MGTEPDIPFAILSSSAPPSLRYITPPFDNYYVAIKRRNYHSSLFNPSIFLKCSSRVTKVSPCSIARATIQISFSGIGCPCLRKRSLMRPYSLLVPISDARTVLAMAKFSIRAAFSFGRPDLKAPEKSSPITVDGMNISPALAICFWTSGLLQIERSRYWCQADIYHSFRSTFSQESSIACPMAFRSAAGIVPAKERRCLPGTPFGQVTTRARAKSSSVPIFPPLRT